MYNRLSLLYDNFIVVIVVIDARAHNIIIYANHKYILFKWTIRYISWSSKSYTNNYCLDDGKLLQN